MAQFLMVSFCTCTLTIPSSRVRFEVVGGRENQRFEQTPPHPTGKEAFLFFAVAEHSITLVRCSRVGCCRASCLASMLAAHL